MGSRPHPRRSARLRTDSGRLPADWAPCRSLFPGNLPRDIGIEVSSTVVAGNLVFGTADCANCSSAGASERAIMDHWFAVPSGLDLTQAAALPMALETAYRSLVQLGLSADHTILIHGAGTTIGFAAGHNGIDLCGYAYGRRGWPTSESAC